MADFFRCKDCKHNKEKCLGISRRGSHKNCFEPKVMTNAGRFWGGSGCNLLNNGERCKFEPQKNSCAGEEEA